MDAGGGDGGEVAGDGAWVGEGHVLGLAFVGQLVMMMSVAPIGRLSIWAVGSGDGAWFSML